MGTITSNASLRQRGQMSRSTVICGIQLLALNNLGETWRRICSLDIRSVSALEVSSNRAVQIDIYLLSTIYNSTEKCLGKFTFGGQISHNTHSLQNQRKVTDQRSRSLNLTELKHKVLHNWQLQTSFDASIDVFKYCVLWLSQLRKNRPIQYWGYPKYCFQISEIVYRISRITIPYI